MVFPHDPSRARKKFPAKLSRLSAAAFFLIATSSCGGTMKFVDGVLEAVGIKTVAVKKKRSIRPEPASDKTARQKSKVEDDDGDSAAVEPKASPARVKAATARDTPEPQKNRRQRDGHKIAESGSVTATNVSESGSDGAPLTVQARFGGPPRAVFSDAGAVFWDDGRTLVAADAQLLPIGRTPLVAPAQTVRYFENAGKGAVAVKENGGVLEIFSWEKRDDGGVVFKKILDDAYDVPFFLLTGGRVALILPDRLQILDFSNPAAAVAAGEVPILAELSAKAGIDDVLNVSSFLYVSRRGFLDVYDFKSERLLSSVQLGRPFQFAGTTEGDGRTNLDVAFTDAKGAWQGLQALTLAEDQSGVGEFGATIDWESPIRAAAADLQNGFVVGGVSDSDGAEHLALLDIKAARFLRGPLFTTPASGWTMSGTSILFLNDQGLTAVKPARDDTVIAQADRVTQLAAKNARRVPLGLIGAVNSAKDEYALQTVAERALSVSAERVAILGYGNAKDVIVFEAAAGGAQKLTVYENALAPEVREFHPENAEGRFDRILTTDVGLFAHDAASGAMRFLDINYKSLQSLPISFPQLAGLSEFATPDGPLLILSGGNGKGAGQVDLVKLKSPAEIETLSRLAVSSRAWAWPLPDAQLLKRGVFEPSELLVLSAEAMTRYNLTDLKNPKAVDKGKTSFPTRQDILAAKLMPSFDAVLLLLKDGAGSRLSVWPIAGTKARREIRGIATDADRFESASFTQGGNVLVLPGAAGVSFYDLAGTGDAPLSTWPGATGGVDVTDGGQFLCAARGTAGTVCGTMNQ